MGRSLLKANVPPRVTSAISFKKLKKQECSKIKRLPKNVRRPSTHEQAVKGLKVEEAGRGRDEVRRGEVEVSPPKPLGKTQRRLRVNHLEKWGAADDFHVLCWHAPACPPLHEQHYTACL